MADGWMNGQRDTQIHVDERMDIWMDVQRNEWMNRWMNEYLCTNT